jgi:hypothetical protein
MLFLGVLLAAIAGCASAPTQVVTGTVRPPISPNDVKIYSHPPPVFEEVAMLDASTHSVFGTGGQKSIDAVIQQLKEQAAKLGANGIIFEGFQDSQSGSIGAGGASGSSSGSSAVGVGLGGSLGIYKKTGQGEAIFVPTPPPGGAPSSGPTG